MAPVSQTLKICLLLVLGFTRTLSGQAENGQERSALWVRAGLDLGYIRVNRQHSGALAGVRFSGGWALSQHAAAGLQAGFYPDGSGADRRMSWMAGPEVRWYPFEDAIALRGGFNLLRFQERADALSPEGSMNLVREKSFRGLVGHIGGTVSGAIGEHALFEFGLELGYAFSGVWRDNITGPVTGRPVSVAFLLGFGID